MKLIHRALVTIFAALTLVSAAGAVWAQKPGSCQELRVMTFNIRYGTAPDGANHWTNRKGFLFGLLNEQKPDVMGLQEALRFQLDEILVAVPGYALLGVGRDDGKTKGEHAAILYRTDRLKVNQHGNFWFSDTPEVPGSKHWGNQITRLCTWARFEGRDGAGSFYVFNVHLDHQSQPSREKSVQLLLKRIEEREHRDPVIVTGDFNADESNPAIAMMKGTAFRDSFRLIHPDATDVLTFNTFKHPPAGTEKIDYVFVDPSVQVREAAIIRDHTDGRYPSDHFPVTATICIPRK